MLHSPDNRPGGQGLGLGELGPGVLRRARYGTAAGVRVQAHGGHWGERTAM